MVTPVEFGGRECERTPFDFRGRTDVFHAFSDVSDIAEQKIGRNFASKSGNGSISKSATQFLTALRTSALC